MTRTIEHDPAKARPDAEGVPAWQVLPARAHFACLAADWDRLNARLHDGHPYYASAFVGPLVEHFAGERDLLCLMTLLGEVRGALLLSPLGNGRWRSFRPAQAQVTPVLLPDLQALRSLWAQLPGAPAWVIEFRAIDPRHAPDFEPLGPRAHRSHHAQTVGIAEPQGFGPYWAGRSAKMRATFKTRFNRLAREGGFTLQCHATPEAVDAAVQRFGGLESAGWKGAAGTAVAADNAQGRFYRDMMRRFAATGCGAVHEIHVAGQLAAAQLLVWSEGMTVFLKTAYDERLSALAPGRILMHRLLEDQLTAHPARVNELYTDVGKSPDWLAWATFDAPIENIEVFRSPGARQVFLGARRLMQRLRGSGGDVPPAAQSAAAPAPSPAATA